MSEEEKLRRRNTLTPRTPPMSTTSGEYPCALCREPITQKRVKCKDCGSRFHPDCHEKANQGNGDPICIICKPALSEAPPDKTPCCHCKALFDSSNLLRKEHQNQIYRICQPCYDAVLIKQAKKSQVQTNDVLATSKPPVEISSDNTKGESITAGEPTASGGNTNESKEPQHVSKGDGSQGIEVQHNSNPASKGEYSRASSKCSSKSSARRREKIESQMQQIKEQQMRLAQQLAESQQKIEALAQLKDDSDDDVSSATTESDLQRTLDWFDEVDAHIDTRSEDNAKPNTQQKPEKIRVTFSTENDQQKRSVIKESTKTKVDSARDYGYEKSFNLFKERAHRSSTPMPWLGAKDNHTFLSGIKEIKSSRESFIGANTSKLSFCEVAARQSVSRKLPKFSGLTSEWPNFIHTYITSTIRCGFSDDENAARLREALTGPALKLVESKLTFPEKVNDVIALLRLKYGRPDQILDSVIEKVEKEDPVMPEDLDRDG